MYWLNIFLFLSQLDILRSEESCSNSPYEDVLTEWEAWKMKHGKVYTVDKVTESGNFSTEESFRMMTWIKNKAQIDQHNREFSLVSLTEMKSIQSLKSQINHSGPTEFLRSDQSAQ